MHIKNIFKQSQDTYGSYRIHAELVDEGIRCGRERVARLARENNLEPKAARRFKVMTIRQQPQTTSDAQFTQSAG